MKKVLFLMNIHDSSGEYSPAIFNWYGILEKLGYEVYYEDYAQYKSEDFYELVKQNKPDYIFHPTYTNLHTEFMRLRQYSKVYCIHSDDDWRFENYIKYWIPFTDGAIGYQNHKRSYTSIGAGENYYHRARWAFNPNMMMHSFEGAKEFGLSHVGGLHGNKAQRIREIEKDGFKVHAVNPNFNSYTAYLEIFSKSTASLCLTSNSVNTGAQSKTRLAEIPFYCALVSESWPDMELWNMVPGKDFILLDGSLNSIEQVNRLLCDPDFANKIYQSGRKVLLEHNTVFHEWNRIMQAIDQDYKPTEVSQILKQHYNL